MIYSKQKNKLSKTLFDLVALNVSNVFQIFISCFFVPQREKFSLFLIYSLFSCSCHQLAAQSLSTAHGFLKPVLGIVVDLVLQGFVQFQVNTLYY